jgi:hypothetical protein
MERPVRPPFCPLLFHSTGFKEMLGSFRRPEPAPVPTSAWIVFAIQVPLTESTTRMKFLRTVESLGCAVLRDGVFLFPNTESNRTGVQRLKMYLQSAMGSAHVLICDATDDMQDAEFRGLFDRSARYDEVKKTVESLRIGFGVSDTAAIAEVVKRQRERFENILAVDFFGSPARAAAEEAIDALERQIEEQLAPPDTDAAPRAAMPEGFLQKLWVTRGPMVADRLASSWLIRRFIDTDAKVKVVDHSTPPAETAVTFGFEGAQFGKADAAFADLVEHFKLDQDAAIQRIGTVVRAIESKDVSIPEAAGFTTILDGARRRATNEGQFTAEAEKIFDMVYERYLVDPAHSAVPAPSR